MVLKTRYIILWISKYVKRENEKKVIDRGWEVW